MLRNIIGRIFNAKNSFSLFFIFSFIFFEKSHSPCRKKKKQTEKRNILDGFSTQKSAIFGRIFNSTAYIYIYAVKLLSGPSLGFSKVIIWAKFVFFKTLLAQNTIKIGVSALFVWKKKCAQTFAKLLSGPSWPFLCCNKLGPDNNINLAQKKAKIRRRDLKEKTRKREKEGTKRKQKKKDKEERKKRTRARERDRERETGKGEGQKRLREKERETQKINKNALLGEKQGFSIKSKERKGTKTTKTKTKINK